MKKMKLDLKNQNRINRINKQKREVRTRTCHFAMKKALREFKHNLL